MGASRIHFALVSLGQAIDELEDACLEDSTDRYAPRDLDDAVTWCLHSTRGILRLRPRARTRRLIYRAVQRYRQSLKPQEGDNP